MVSLSSTFLILIGAVLGEFVLRPLPFDQDALAPFISEKTMSYHYGKHHAGYVKKLNTQALEYEDIQDKSIIEIIQNARDYPIGIVNNAAQIFNHDFYWDCIKPMDGNQVDAKQEAPFGMSAKLYATIGKYWNDFGTFKEEFTTKAKKHFGSGWIWLVLTERGTLMIGEGHDAQTPLQFGEVPLLTIDVWEHAYYLDKQNNRGQYVDEYFERINWKFVSEQYENAIASKQEL